MVLISGNVIWWVDIIRKHTWSPSSSTQTFTKMFSIVMKDSLWTFLVSELLWHQVALNGHQFLEFWVYSCVLLGLGRFTGRVSWHSNISSALESHVYLRQTQLFSLSGLIFQFCCSELCIHWTGVQIIPPCSFRSKLLERGTLFCLFAAAS